MAAMGVEKAGTAAAIPEEHEILAQDPHGTRGIARRWGQPHRLPVAAKKLPGRRPGTHMGELGVFSRTRPPVAGLHREG